MVEEFPKISNSTRKICTLEFIKEKDCKDLETEICKNIKDL